MADEGDLNPQMEKILKAMGQSVPDNKRILEINADHPLFAAMNEPVREGQGEPRPRTVREAPVRPGAPSGRVEAERPGGLRECRGRPDDGEPEDRLIRLQGLSSGAHEIVSSGGPVGYDYDLVVIGGGAAGLVASKLGAGLGKKVAIVEKSRLGGECTLYGCVPSKALIKTARVYRQMRDPGGGGPGFAARRAPPASPYTTDGVFPRVRCDYREGLPGPQPGGAGAPRA